MRSLPQPACWCFALVPRLPQVGTPLALPAKREAAGEAGSEETEAGVGVEGGAPRLDAVQPVGGAKETEGAPAGVAAIPEAGLEVGDRAKAAKEGVGTRASVIEVRPGETNKDALRPRSSASLARRAVSSASISSWDITALVVDGMGGEAAAESLVGESAEEGIRADMR